MEPQGERAAPSLLPALAIVALLVAYVSYEPPLESSRPPVEGNENRPNPGADESVPAQLWEDPFAAIGPTQAATEGGNAALETVETRLRDPKKARVIAISVSAGTSPGRGEKRLRRRYAVVQALARAHYLPERAGRIGALPTTAVGGVPFEWYRRETQQGGAEALVVWVDEDTLNERPLSKISELKRELGDPEKFVWVGPQSSDTLKRLLIQAADFGGAAPKHRGVIQIVSPTATASYLDLRNEAPGICKATHEHEAPCKSDIDKNLKTAGFELTRTIQIDDRLAEALEREIRQRVAPFQCQRTLILYEWDTAYSRRLASSFASKLDCAEQDLDREASAGSSEGNEIYRMRYLRGIDGLKSTGRHKEEDRRKAGLEQMGPEEGASRAHEPKPSGTDQRDYLYRMLREVRKIAKRGSGIDVVAVFGTDIFDKLLLFRGLRQELPGAVFATTDMDAFLLHQDERPWTRNLVVASSWGLSPGSRSENGKTVRAPVPVFRDSYQTSIFETVVDAANDAEPKEPSESPLLFEIGVDGPVALPPTQSAVVDATLAEPDGAGASWGWAPEALLILAAIATLWIGARLSRSVRRFSDFWFEIARTPYVWGPLLIVVAVSLWANVEPGFRYALDGVSVWPNILVHYVVALLAIYWTWLLVEELPTSLSALIASQGSDGAGASRLWTEASKEAGSEPNAWRKYRSLVRRVSISDWDAACDQHEWDAVLKQYSLREYRMARLVRLGLPVLATVVLGALIVWSSGALSAPYRGWIARLHYWASLLLALGATVILLHGCADAIRLCSRWFENAARALERSDGDAARIARLEHLQFLAKRSAQVESWVYYPFAALTLLVISRMGGFDYLAPDLSGWLLFAGLYAYIIGVSMWLRHVARRIKRDASIELRAHELNALKKPEGSLPAQLFADAEAILERTCEGAFSAMSSNPVLGALFLPPGGFGLVTLLQLWLSPR